MLQKNKTKHFLFVLWQRLYLDLTQKFERKICKKKKNLFQGSHQFMDVRLTLSTLFCFSDSACLSPQCVPAAASSHRSANYKAALWPHEAEVQRVRPGTDAAELEVLDRIFVSVTLVNYKYHTTCKAVSNIVRWSMSPSPPGWASHTMIHYFAAVGCSINRLPQTLEEYQMLFRSPGCFSLNPY